MTEETKDKILKRLDEIEQKITEYFYLTEEEKKIIQIEQVKLDIPAHIKTIAVPTRWVNYKLEYFSNATYKYALTLRDSYPGDNWLRLRMWLFASIVFNEEKLDLATARIETVREEEDGFIHEHAYLTGKYVTFERTGEQSFILTKNQPETYVYRLILRDFVTYSSCWNDVKIVNMGNTISYKAICIAPLKELRLYMILPTRESTKISISHIVPGGDEYRDFIISWNNGDPTVVQEVENEV